jgi:hypothetical protein
MELRGCAWEDELEPRDAEARAPGPTYLFKIHTRPTTGVLVL